MPFMCQGVPRTMPKTLYMKHNALSDPGVHRASIQALAGAPRPLAGVIQGLLIHDSGLSHYGLSDSDFADVSRKTLPVAERLSHFAAEGSAAELRARAPAERSIGTCRDYALLMTGFLREHGFEARVRCGFASYFAPGRYEDHWICEHRRSGEGDWRRADVQLDETHLAAFAIAFDPLDLPGGAFVPAGRIWSRYRQGNLEPELCGAGERTGPGIMAVDVARDYLALCGQEISHWDGWREGERKLTGSELTHADELATEIETFAVRESDGLDPQRVGPPFWM